MNIINIVIEIKEVINTSPAKWPGKYRCPEEGLIQVMTSLTHHLPNGQVSTGVLKKQTLNIR
jgi:hypothetical protein